MGEWFNTTIIVVAGVLTVLNLIDKVVGWVKDLKKPQNDLESRVALLERKVEGEYKLIFASYDEKLQRDYDSINSIKKTNSLIIQSLLALTKHAEDGNNIEDLKDARKELEKYISTK